MIPLDPGRLLCLIYALLIFDYVVQDHHTSFILSGLFWAFLLIWSSPEDGILINT
jgi:hypothetical protein